MNIEDIKGKLHNYEHFYAGDSEEAYKDFIYLLSIIEQAEIGLLHVVDACGRSERKTIYEQFSLEMSLKALKAIRGE